MLRKFKPTLYLKCRSLSTRLAATNKACLVSNLKHDFYSLGLLKIGHQQNQLRALVPQTVDSSILLKLTSANSSETKPNKFSQIDKNLSELAQDDATATKQPGQDENDNKASAEQLENVEKRLSLCLPKFFDQGHPYGMYTSDLVFINNINGTKIYGLTNYSMRGNFFRVYHNLRYIKSEFKLLNVVKNPQESFIKIRWRLMTRSGPLVFTYRWLRGLPKDASSDGISTFHVNNQGLIYCHVCDNIERGVDQVEKKKIPNPFVTREVPV